MLAFLWSGYMPVLSFRHVTGRAVYVVRLNSGLLYHRAVTPFDLFISVAGLEAMGNLAAAAFSFMVFYLVGMIAWPDDLPLVLAGFLFANWWSLAVALVVAALSERSELVEHIWAPVAYMYMPLCGFIFMAAWLPSGIRQIALTIDPPLHTFEMIRAGLFGDRIQTYYDPVYLTYILATLTLVGLWAMRHVRHHIDVA